MQRLLSIYRGPYYALMDLNYTFIPPRRFDESLNIAICAFNAIMVYTIVQTVITVHTLRLAVTFFKTNETPHLLGMVFGIIATLNAFSLYNTQQNEEHIREKGGVSGFSYGIALALAFGVLIFLICWLIFDFTI